MNFVNGMLFGIGAMMIQTKLYPDAFAPLWLGILFVTISFFLLIIDWRDSK